MTTALTPTIVDPKTAARYVQATITETNARARVGRFHRVATATAALTIKAPSGAQADDTFAVWDKDANAGAHNITIDGDGVNIEGAATATIATNGLAKVWILDSTLGWRLIQTPRATLDGKIVYLQEDLPAPPTTGLAVTVGGVAIGAGPYTTFDFAGASFAGADGGATADIDLSAAVKAILTYAAAQAAALAAAGDSSVWAVTGGALVFTKIVDANIDAAAAIALSKLGHGAGDEVVTTNAAGNALQSRKLVDANIDAAAAIAISKIAGAPSVDTYANRPAAGNAGRRFLASDGYNDWVDDGASWRPIVNGVMGTQPAAVASWTAINAGGRATTSTDDAGTLHMVAANGVAADDYRLLKKARPGAAHTVIAHIRPTLMNAQYSGCGLLWRNSANGDCIFFGPFCNNNIVPVCVRYETASSAAANPTFTFSSDDLAIGNSFVPELGVNGWWLRLQDDGAANRTFSWSGDGRNWRVLLTQARATHFTPDEYGVYIAPTINSAGTGTYAEAVFDSLLVSTP